MIVTSIFILHRRHGADYISLKTNLPEGCFPFKENQSFHAEVARDSAEGYAMTHFPGVRLEVQYEEGASPRDEGRKGDQLG